MIYSIYLLPMQVFEKSSFSINPFAHEQKLLKFRLGPLHVVQLMGVPQQPLHLLSQKMQPKLIRDV